MKAAVDSSVLVAALDGGDPDHEACRKLLLAEKLHARPHALSETFSTLTGGRLAIRISAEDAAKILRQQMAPRLKISELSESDLLEAFDESQRRGVRGGAIYDFLHLVAARKAGAKKFYTLNLDDFRSFHRSGDPEIAQPSVEDV